MTNPENRTTEQDQSMNQLLLEEEPFIEGNQYIKGLKNNRDKLAREERLINDSVDDSIAYYSDMKNKFEHMKIMYGINIPDYDIVIRENKVFLVVDKIDGKGLDKITELPENAKAKLENFFVGLLKSMFDAHKERRPFFNDMNLGNFMYGHKSKDKDAEDDFFLSDIGSAPKSVGGFKDPDEQIIFTYDYAFVNNVKSIKKDIDSLAQTFSIPSNFTRFEQILKEIEDYIKANIKEETIEQFLERLRNNN